MGKIRRLIAAVIVLPTLLAATLLLTGQPATAAALYSRLQNAQSWFCMDDYARERLVYHYPCNTQLNQQWTWRKANPSAGDNRWLIINRESGYCLNQTGYEYYKDVRIRPCAGTGDPDQWWRWVRSSNHVNLWFIESWYRGFQNERLCVATSNSDTYSKLILGGCGEWLAHLWYQEPPS